MAPFTIGILAISMSVDAFVASIGRGASASGRARAGAGVIVATGATFGLIEAITPLIGWLMGVAASAYVEVVDHWIAFGLLFAVGLRMILNALKQAEEAPRRSGGWLAVVATAVGTSLDAMAVGVSLAFLDVNIVVIAVAIGATTMVMSMAGMWLGQVLGQRFGRVIEGIGGLALIGIGSTILYEHLAPAI